MVSLCLEYKVTKRKKTPLNCACCNQINQVTKLWTYIFDVSELFGARNLLLYFYISSLYSLIKPHVKLRLTEFSSCIIAGTAEASIYYQKNVSRLQAMFIACLHSAVMDGSAQRWLDTCVLTAMFAEWWNYDNFIFFVHVYWLYFLNTCITSVITKDFFFKVPALW